jgi:hypothetical protein
MKHIRSYNSFKENKNKKNTINEEFIGGLLKKLGNKISMGFSKKFGSASKVDKMMEEYKNEVMGAWVKKKNALIAYGKAEKTKKDGGEKSDDDIKQLVDNLKEVSENYKKAKELIKKKFDIKFNEIIKDEKNEKIKNYLNIKKIEMEQELLQMESNALLQDSGLTEDDIKDIPAMKEILKGIAERSQKSEEMKAAEGKAIESEGGDSEEEAKFDFVKAKTDSNYKWEDSKYVKEYSFTAGEELVYHKEEVPSELSDKDVKGENSEYRGTKAYVMADDKQKNEKDGQEVDLKGTDSVRITLDINDEKNNGFIINKGKIISTKKDQEESAKKEEEKKKEEESKPEESNEIS